MLIGEDEMQVSKIAVSNGFSANQNQKTNVNKKNPNFGWVACFELAEDVNPHDIVQKVGRHFWDRQFPADKVNSVVDMGRVLTWIDTSRENAVALLERLSIALHGTFKSIALYGKEMSECSGKTLDGYTPEKVFTPFVPRSKRPTPTVATVATSSEI